MEDFEEQIREMVEIRKDKEARENEVAKTRGEYEYTKFKCWCNAFKNGQGKNNAKVFAEFVKAENIELTFWQKKAIAEKYFGYEYNYDYEKDEWITKKKRSAKNG